MKKKTLLISVLVMVVLSVTALLLISLVHTVPYQDNNTAIQSLVDSYTASKGVTYRSPDSFRFLLVTDTHAETELAQLISQQFAAADIPSSMTMPVITGQTDDARRGDVILEIDFDAAGGQAEGYKLEIDRRNIHITGADSRGLLYGAFMVIKLERANGCSGSLGGCVIQDAPDAEERAVLLDCGRKYFTPEWIKNFIREMAYMGYNAIELHFAEDQGFRLDIWDEDYFTSANGNDFSWFCGGWVASWVTSYYPKMTVGNNINACLTAGEIIDIIELAHQYQMDVIPSFDSPMHCQYLRREWYTHVNETDPAYTFNYGGKQYSAQGVTDLSTGVTTPYEELSQTYYNTCWESILVKNDNGNRTNTKVIDVTNPVARAFLLAILDDLSDFFRQQGCTEFNVCADESAFYTLDGWQRYARTVLGISGGSKYDTFIDYVNEITNILQEKGYHVRAFSDFIDMDGTGFKRQTLEFDPELEILYWALPEDHPTVQPVSTFAGRYTLYNCVQNYCYYNLANCQAHCHTEPCDARDPDIPCWNWQYASEDRIWNYWNPTVFTHRDNEEKDGQVNELSPEQVAGGYFLIWCDYANLSTESEIWNGIDQDGTYSVISRMWSNITKMWNYDVNQAINYEEFAALRDLLGHYPGYTNCTEQTILPVVNAGEKG